jgi:hypothetical protein
VRFVLGLSLAAVLAAGIASPTGNGGSERPRVQRSKYATVLALRSGRAGAELLRLDSRTLAPADRRRVALGSGPGGWARSPDGRRLAIGVPSALGLRIVDLTRMRTTGEVKTRNGEILAAAWLTPRRIVGVEATGVFVVDPVARRLVRAAPLDGHPVGVGRTADALVLLLAPTDEVGAARLAVVDAHGALRSIVLDPIVAGFRHPVAQGSPGESWTPGLALDAVGGRAFVVGSGAPIAEVELATLTVRYHEPARKASLFDRLRRWLEPDAHAKGPVAGGWRRASWLGGGFLAVTGEDGRPVGPDSVESTSAGVTLIDTRSWEARTLAPRANAFAFVGGTLLTAMHDPFDASPGIGIRAFSRDGSTRFHRLGSQQIALMGTVTDRVFVDAIGGTQVVRARDGRVSRWRRDVPDVLVGSMRRY